jgi:predicted dehydrogenase
VTIRVGVIGCGAQGRHHLATYQAISDVTIAAACDTNPERLVAAGSEFGAEGLFDDYRQLLAAQDYDLISVCTMPHTHREIAVAALKAGAHVLCEKPVALDATEAAAMVAAARRAGRFLTFGLNMRSMPSAQWVKWRIEEGAIGRPFYTRAWTLANDIPWWGKHYVKAISGGGVLASTAVHILDLSLWLLGQPQPVTASASLARTFPRKRGGTAPDATAAASYDVEDLFSGHIRFADGTWLTLEAGWSWDRPDYSYSCEIVGDLATVQLDPVRLIGEHHGVAVDRTPHGVGGTNWPQSVTTGITAVVDAVRQGTPPPIGMEEGLRLQVLIDALYRSAELGREVAVEPVEISG